MTVRIKREIDSVIVHRRALSVSHEYSNLRVTKAIAACNRLRSIAPGPTILDENYRITEDQWVEMAKQIPIIEQILADTKELIQRYFDAVDASMIGFYQ